MRRRLCSLFAACAGAVALASFAAASGETTTQTIALDRAAHFTAPDESDVQLAAGEYRVEAGGESQLRLVTSGGQPIQIAATNVPHEETIITPMAMAVIEEGQEDQLHLVLVLPGGQALDASGSYSGVRSRAALLALKPAQLQSAVSQVKVIPQPMLPQSVPPIAVIRVPAGGAGSVVGVVNQGTWITWNYLAMEHPEIVAQAFADVQAGKQTISSLSGFALPAELSAMLRTNWAAEVARLNAAALQANQGGIIPRGVPPNSKMALTPAIIVAIPVSLPAKNLGNVWAGQTATAVVSITAPADSYVEGRLDLNATNRHFRIVNATSYTGKIVNGHLEVAQILSGGQYQDVVVDADNAPAEISKAGFVSILARQGQRIDLTIAFEPVALGMTPVGDNEAILNLSGPTTSSIDIHGTTQIGTWRKTVPIRAYFSGINFGAILYTDHQHAAALTGQSVDMTVLVRNAASTPITGTLTVVQLPPGVTMMPVPASVGPQATQRFTLHFKVAGTAQQGAVQPVVVQLNYSNQTRLLTLDMSIYEPWVWWGYGYYDTQSQRFIPPPGIPVNRSDQSGDTGVEQIFASLKNNGEFWWRIATYNMKHVDVGGSNFDVFARLNAIGSTDRIAVHIGPRTNPQYYESTKNLGPLAAGPFLAAAEQGLRFSLIDR